MTRRHLFQLLLAPALVTVRQPVPLPATNADRLMAGMLGLFRAFERQALAARTMATLTLWGKAVR